MPGSPPTGEKGGGVMIFAWLAVKSIVMKSFGYLISPNNYPGLTLIS